MKAVKEKLNLLYIGLNKKENYYIIILLIGFIVLSLLKIHGSSIGAFNQNFNGEQKDESLIFGVPRGIRSDEWAMGTPLQVSQVYTSFSENSDLIGYEGQNIAFMNSGPVKHWTNFFDVLDWGYFLLNIEQGYAFRWLSKGLLLLVASYLLLMKLSDNKILISIGFSIAVLFNPFVQWWYSTTAVETLGYGFLIMFLLVKIFEYKNLRDLVGNSILLSYFIIAFGFNLYPPFQVPIILGAVFFFVGYSLNNFQILNKKKMFSYAVSILSVLVIISFFFYRYYFDFKSIIEIMQNTSYPGKRVIAGGDYSLLSLLSNVFSVKLQLSSSTIPVIWGNQCEASRFLDFPLFTIPVAIFWNIKLYLKEKKIDFILLGITAYLIISIIWLFGGLNPFLAGISLLNMVPTNRMLIGLGSFDLLIIFYLLSKRELLKTTDYKIMIFLLSAMYLVVNLYVGKTLKLNYPTYLNADYQIWGASILFSITFIFWGLFKERLFLLLFVMTSLFYSAGVNPIYRGLGVLINSDFSNTVQQVVHEDSSSEWAFYDIWYMANFLKANGAPTLNGTQLYPQFEMWKLFDEEENFTEIYNRYAHIQMLYSLDLSEIVISTPQPDMVNLKINPCNPILLEMNVNVFVFPYMVEDECLELVNSKSYAFSSLYVYERVR